MTYFIEEFLAIRQNGGINIERQTIPIKIRSFIADAPARSFILNHQGHMGSNACSKCKVKGIRLFIFHIHLAYINILYIYNNATKIDVDLT